MSTYISQREIANLCGVSFPTVCRALHGTAQNGKRQCSKETEQRIREVAIAYGYRWLRTGNFETKDIETERMLALREQGFSNAEIAKKVGRSQATVIHRIGTQDAEMTANNKRIGGELRRKKTAERKEYVAEKAIADYRKQGEALRAKLEQVESLSAQIEALRNECTRESAALAKPNKAIESACKVCGIDYEILRNEVAC